MNAKKEVRQNNCWRTDGMPKMANSKSTFHCPTPKKKTHTHTYTIIEQIRIDCTLKWGCNLSHVILAHHWFCLAHYILLYGRTDDDIGLENGTNLESTPNVFLFDLVLNTTSFPFTLSIDLLYKECCRLYFISLLRSFIRFLCVFVSFSVRSA